MDVERRERERGEREGRAREVNTNITRDLTGGDLARFSEIYLDLVENMKWCYCLYVCICEYVCLAVFSLLDKKEVVRHHIV